MFDLPIHLGMWVTKDGQGPAMGEDKDHLTCWCGDTECKEWVYTK